MGKKKKQRPVFSKLEYLAARLTGTFGKSVYRSDHIVFLIHCILQVYTIDESKGLRNSQGKRIG